MTRDLRDGDNQVLLTAATLRSTFLQSGGSGETRDPPQIVPLFLATPEQLGEDNPYRGIPAVRFMYRGLRDLTRRLSGHLHITSWSLDDILRQYPIDGVVISKDYTEYAIQRNARYHHWCEDYHVPFYEVSNHTLFPLDQYVSRQGTPYQVFAPFYRRVRDKLAMGEGTPSSEIIIRDHLTTLPGLPLLEIPDDDPSDEGTRDYGLAILSRLSSWDRYSLDRNKLTFDGTGLAPYHKFGLISIRETAHAIITHLGYDHELLRQLLWHDYYYAVPPPPERPLEEEWNDDPIGFARWTTGTTGYPLVDAGMRQLNATGMIHNRARMIVANFLTSHMKINWRYGAHYFATHLVDYDPLINNHSWRDVNNCGVTRHRTEWKFHLRSQAVKYDGLRYIRRWIPELATVPDRDVMGWDHSRYQQYGSYYDPLPLP